METIKVLVVFLSLVATSATAADPTYFIVKLCSQTLEFDTCTNCILKDRSRGTDEIPDLIHTVLYCMYSEAVYGHDHANGLTNSSLPEPYRTALRSCSGGLFAASNALWDAMVMMEKENFYGAFGNMKQVRWSLISCCNAFRTVADAAVPRPLIDDMMFAKRLFDVAHALFRQIIKINPF